VLTGHLPHRHLRDGAESRLTTPHYIGRQLGRRVEKE